MDPALTSAAHLHVLLNHLPVTGLAMGTLALILALFLRSRPAQIVALVLVFIGSAGAWAVNATGERAYKNIRGLADDAGTDWLDAHQERAEKAAPLFTALAVLALAALLAPTRWPRAAVPLACATLLLALAANAAASWIAIAGGRVRHPEFRGSAVAFPDDAAEEKTAP